MVLLILMHRTPNGDPSRPPMIHPSTSGKIQLLKHKKKVMKTMNNLFIKAVNDF